MLLAYVRIRRPVWISPPVPDAIDGRFKPGLIICCGRNGRGFLERVVVIGRDMTHSAGLREVLVTLKCWGV